MAESPELLERLRTALEPRFELVGAAPAVVRARERSSGALLRLQIFESASGLDLERLEAELARHARVVHEHILPVSALGRGANLVWLAQPELEGAVSLRTWLEREQRLPFLETVRVLRECAQALDHAHALGSLHLELAPERVLWHQTHVQLSGLGVRPSCLSAGLPEHARDREGAQRDVFALGALAFEMLTGAPPPQGCAPSPARVRAHIPPGLARLVVRSLSPAASARPQDMREVVRLLEGLVTPVPDWRAQSENQARYLRALGRARPGTDARD